MTEAAARTVEDDVLSRTDFDRLARLVGEEAGLDLQYAKVALISSRLRKRLRVTGHRDLSSYVGAVCGAAASGERRALIGCLTTNLTSFFREPHHFATLRRDVLPGLADRARGGGRVRLWSAGCSSGQEPYSIAMTLLDVMPDAAAFDIRILATDIDDGVLDSARRGSYDESQTADLPREALSRHFTSPVVGAPGRTVRPEVAELVSFRYLNLIDRWPMRGAFDVIFCRNVTIYFSARTQATLWKRFLDALGPGGWLFVGHSERIPPEVSGTSLRAAGVTTYRRNERSLPSS